MCRACGVKKLKRGFTKRNWLVMDPFDLYLKGIRKIITNIKPRKIFAAERVKKATEQEDV
jgi:hypothetical protein